MSVACGAARASPGSIPSRGKDVAEAVGLEEQHEDGRDGQRRRRDPDDLHDLLLDGRGPDDLARLQVLHVVAGDGGRAAHHRPDQDGRGLPPPSPGPCLTAKSICEPRRRKRIARDGEDRGDGDAGDGVVRGADEAGHVARHRREQEAGNESEDDAEKDRRPVQPVRDVEVALVDDEEEDDEDGDGEGRPCPRGRTLIGVSRSVRGTSVASPARAFRTASSEERTPSRIGPTRETERPRPPDRHRPDAEVADPLAPQRRGRPRSRSPRP